MLTRRGDFGTIHRMQGKTEFKKTDSGNAFGIFMPANISLAGCVAGIFILGTNG